MSDIKVLKFGTSSIGKIGSNIIGFPPFNPSFIGGVELWLDGSNIDSFTFSSSNVVSQWMDISGKNRNFTEGTVSFQPTRSIDGGVDFTGTKKLACTFSDIIPQNNTIIIVYKSASFANSFVLDGVNSTVNRRLLSYESGLLRYSNSPQIILTTIRTLNNIFSSFIENPTISANGKYFEQNIQRGADFNAGSTAIDGLTLGNRHASPFSNGQHTIYEIIIFSKVLQVFEKEQLQNYFNTKYGL